MRRISKEVGFQILLRSSRGTFGNQVNVGGRESSSTKSSGSRSKRLCNPESMFEAGAFVAVVCC